MTTRKYLHHPVAHLRKEPIAFAGTWKDPLQETQLLYGDPLDVVKEDGEWSYVQLPQQQKFDFQTQRWVGYPGWLETRLLGDKSIAHSSNHKEFDSHQLVADAEKFLNTPYLWGGASPYNPQSPHCTGVDCSGLIYLIHKMQGVYVPRDAHDQWLRSTPILGSELVMGDVIFIELNEKKGRIDHVMLYAGERRLIEAVIRPGIVREISFEERVGVSLEECQIPILKTSTQVFSFRRLSFN